MLTKKGTSLLNEIKSEADTALKERSKALMINDLNRAIHFMLFLVKQWLWLFFIFLIAPVMLLIVFSDASMITLLTTTATDTLITLKNHYLTFAISASLMTTCVISIPKAIDRFKRSKAIAATDTEQALNRQRQHVELIEEVLYRHQLIDHKDAP